MRKNTENENIHVLERDGGWNKGKEGMLFAEEKTAGLNLIYDMALALLACKESFF